MCRFLLAKSNESFSPQPILQAFADMAEKSKAFDGDWQGDGWGVSWLDEKNEWQTYKSLLPVWQDKENFTRVPQTRTLTIHARSASFPSQKGVLEFNQPYVSDRYSFVFNGFLKGVSLSPIIPGKIGAEKIWYLLQNFLKNNDPQTSLEKLKQLMLKKTKEVQALNVGLADKHGIYSLNYFTKHPEYYNLHSFTHQGVELTCSEKIML